MSHGERRDGVHVVTTARLRPPQTPVVWSGTARRMRRKDLARLEFISESLLLRRNQRKAPRIGVPFTPSLPRAAPQEILGLPMVKCGEPGENSVSVARNSRFFSSSTRSIMAHKNSRNLGEKGEGARAARSKKSNGEMAPGTRRPITILGKLSGKQFT
ncbi:hypothetical protein NDU88_001750 [Pleurodeles waltl]|uniref:Uncharacterized protein n=1 Tax=Pleurodeles waltl TaxID=8319 RepID=A0AAV7LGW6_PLEWA|nr:hypothetical protein NDU88_001750 [Pleurodeles waltl]